jgi:hypothetical protein
MSKKEVRKTLRFSADEYKQIEKNLDEHKLTFSDFARSAILKKKVHTKLTADMIYQVQRVGNNLNQIVKLMHTQNLKKDPIPNSEVIKKLIEIEKAIKEFSNDR